MSKTDNVASTKKVGSFTNHGQPDVQHNTIRLTGQQAEDLRQLGFEVTDPNNVTFEVHNHDEPAVVLKPATMNLLDAAKELRLRYEADESEQNFVREFKDRHYTETLVAINRCFERILHTIHGVKTGFFGPAPSQIHVVVDIKDGAQVTEAAYYGDFKVSALEDAIAKIRITGHTQVNVAITAKKKFAPYIAQMFSLVEEELRENSIFRGKSVVVTASPDDENIPMLTLVEIKPNPAIFLNPGEELIVRDYIIDELGNPGKRTYLFTGSYGNAKTETAMRIAYEANQRGLTFFYVKNANFFAKVLEMTAMYGGSVVFCEDLDEIISGSERTATINEILNTLDGVQTKGSNRVLRVVLTTNQIDRLNDAVRRPGRVDVIKVFENPDKATQARILNYYFKSSGLEGADALDYSALYEFFGQGLSGATVAEIAKRSVIQARKNGSKVTDAVVQGAFASMEYHINLMRKNAETEVPTVDGLLRQMLEGMLTPLVKQIQEVQETVENL